MYRKIKLLVIAALTVSLFLAVPGCRNESGDQNTGDSETVNIEIAEQPPVSGWLEVVLPGVPIAMDACGEDLWILMDEGTVMKWNSTEGEWSAVETEAPETLSETAFAISATESGVALLTPLTLLVFSGEEATETGIPENMIPTGLCATEQGFAVLFTDGSVSLFNGTELVQIVASAGKIVTGSFCSGDSTLAWINQDGTVSRFDMNESLLTEVLLPVNAADIQMSQGVILAGDGELVFRFNGVDSWEECYTGRIAGENLLYTIEGIRTFDSDTAVTAGMTEEPRSVCRLNNGMIWSISGVGLAVWAEIGSVETRLPEADVQRIRYRISGQTGTGSAGGSGIAASDVSFGGVFRIYESVSSRPDPFTEFPLARRDLRRSVQDLTIEELHLVGITIDPSGGDQAMVEDADGVAYILREGTILRNNTHIAEISGNEVIVIQEVTVGSEDGLGGTTTIPTIFSMRLHEEGGL
jgi:hypothetical protein